MWVSFIMRFTFESQDLEIFLSLQVWSSDVGFMWASSFKHWTLVSCVEPRIWVSILWRFSLSSWYWPCILFFAATYSLSPLTKRNHLGHIDSTDPNVLFSLGKTTFAFIERQARLTGNYSGSQSCFSKIVSRRARGICIKETISGFVRPEPPWSIIGLHPDNVGHDASVWSQILPSPILFKKVIAMSTMHLKVTGKGTSPVRSRILPSSILFKKVTAMRNSCSLE